MKSILNPPASAAAWLAGLLVAGLIMAGPAVAQDVRSLMFEDADAAREAAVASKAAIYSPRNFERAQKAYQQAAEDYDNNRNLERIRNGLAEAREAFRAAEQISRQAQIELAPVMKSRQDARDADGALHAGRDWREAEERFGEAIVEFERGDRRLSERRAGEAQALYRSAELTAIKASVLNEARRVLAMADDARAERYAPVTFARARSLLSEAEKALNEDRYDADRPRDLAREAEYEARHALYLAQQANAARRDRVGVETFILAGEAPLREIAGVADLSVDFTDGYESATSAIVEYVRGLQTRNRSLGQDLAERDEQVQALRAELLALEARYGGVSEERRALERRLEAQSRVRQQFAEIERLFAGDEAEVLRVSGDIVIRLVGTSFAVGKSDISPPAYPLLAKVMDAIRVFPAATVVIEGHTDSHGSDEFNLTLSQKRAEAVMAYLLANMRMPVSRLSATGYGETRPISNNETAEGRARNRRIDIVINPNVVDD